MERVVTLRRRHPGQTHVWQNASRFNVLACGRRWGKTSLGIEVIVRVALAGMPAAWGAPHYKYLAEPFRELRRILKPVTERASDADKRIDLITGGSIDFWTLDDPDAGRGRMYARWVIDEAASVTNLEVLWPESIRPTLTDLVGDAWILGTPKGHNAFYRLFMTGQDPLETEWSSWQCPTSDNPRLDPAEIEAARHGLPEAVFAQEYEAAFNTHYSGFFTGLDNVIGHSVYLAQPEPGRTYQAGVDLARKHDYSVVTVVDDHGRQVAFARWRGVAWQRQVRHVARICSTYQCPAVVDATGLGDVMVESLRAAGVGVLPYIFTATSRAALLDNLALMIEKGEVALLDEPVQTAELRSVEYASLPGGGWRADVPPNAHDDTVMALALACWHGVRRSKFDVEVQTV